MSLDLGLLYAPEIRDHARNPRHARRLAAPTHEARGDNPMCGDRVTLGLRVEAGTIAEIGAVARGCEPCVASASMMGEAVLGLGVAAARAKADAVRAMLRSGEVAPGDEPLAPLAAAHAFPSRVKCAELAWAALDAALGGRKEATSE